MEVNYYEAVTPAGSFLKRSMELTEKDASSQGPIENGKKTML